MRGLIFFNIGISCEYLFHERDHSFEMLLSLSKQILSKNILVYNIYMLLLSMLQYNPYYNKKSKRRGYTVYTRLYAVKRGYTVADFEN